MPKIFISYRRKSWPFTHRLADELSKRIDAELFVDYTGVDETDFERSILRHLRESDAVLLVISEHTFEDRIHKDDDWVRREIREALTLGKKLVLVCIEGRLPPPGLPDDIKDVARMQGINFYPEYFAPGVEKLADFIIKIGVAGTATTAPSPQPAPTPPASGEKSISGKATLDEALALLDDGDYAKAIFLLESLRALGYASRYVDVEALLKQAEADAEQVERRRLAKLDYDEIVLLAARRVTQAQAQAAFAAWCKDYPDLVEHLDEHKLRERFKPTPPKRRPSDLLPPPFEWIDIPAGKVTLVTEKGWAKNYIPEGGSRTFDVPAFAIAKYPVTNAQFARFIEAGGYDQQRWWTADGWKVRQSEKWTEPRYWDDANFNPPNHPVVGVSWYEAIAFCHWLSEATGDKITLPTEQGWQRAAQGDTGWAYPWGDAWDCKRCNNSVKPCDSNATTPVTHYEGRNKGDSPFGVVDMSGNVWEWCLTKYESGETGINGTDVRVLRGGSWRLYNTPGLRVDSRNRSNPHLRSYYFGFRLALS